MSQASAEEAPDVEVDEDSGETNLYIVEAILDKRGSGDSAQYLIKWRGYDNPEDNTWEPLINCDCADMIREFEEKLENAKNKRKKPERKSGARLSTSRTSVPSEDTPSSSSRTRRNATTTPTSVPPSKKSRPNTSRVVLNSSSDEEYTEPSQVSEEPVEKTTKKTPKQKQAKKKANSPVKAAATKEPSVDNSTSVTSIETPAVLTNFSPDNITETAGTSQLRPLRPVADVPELPFIVRSINGIYNDNGYVLAVVTCDLDDDFRCVELKAVARQNVDLFMDFIVTRLEV